LEIYEDDAEDRARRVTAAPTDDEIIAALSDTTKQQMLVRAQDLLAGKASAPWFNPTTNAEMIQYQLMEIRHVATPPARGFFSSTVNAMIVLTPTGSRVLQRLMQGDKQ
jgi:hypothetical protein